MTTAAQLRKLALSLPDVQEKSHFGQPDFRVSGKIFAGLSRDGSRANLKLTTDTQLSIVNGSSRCPFTLCAGAWGRSGWTYVDLSAVETAMLRQLVGEAWRLVAPKKLAAAHATNAPAPGTPATTTPAKTARKKSSRATRS